MAKKKDKPQVINNIQELNLEIDYDKLAESIVKAKQIEEENSAKKKTEELASWRKSIGIKNHEDKKGIKKNFFVCCNRIKVFFKLLFFSRKEKLHSSMTGAFMQSLTAAFFSAIKWILWILSIAFIGVSISHGNMLFGLLDYVYYIGFALIAFMLGGIFRLMAIETEQITDRERVLGIFTAVMSVIPMIEIIVSFFKEVG